MDATLKNNSNLNLVYTLLKYTFGIVPIVAGADKFLNILTNWAEYVPTVMTDLLPISATVLMMIVGIIEIAAGLIVLKKPAIGGLIVAAWLTLIALTLIIGFNYFDVAVRDLIMAVAAFSLSRLANEME